jgi:hypothetical protein
MRKPGDCETTDAGQLEGAQGCGHSALAGVGARPFLESLARLLGELQGLELPVTLALELSIARLEILKELRLSQNQNRD